MKLNLRLPVLSCAESAAAEAAYIGKNKNLGWTLMQRASHAVAHEANSLLGHKPTSILALVGSGKNGADALLAARFAASPTTRITVVFASGTPRSGLPLKAWLKVKKGVRVITADKLSKLSSAKFCLIFDGILGQGFHPPLQPTFAQLIRDSHKLEGLRVAVDLPSGLGDDCIGPAFQADLTVSIGCLKRPLLAPRAQKFVGRIRVADIGLPLAETAEACSTHLALAPLNKPRKAQTEKRAQGRLLIVGGSDSMPGAVIMNTAAALQSGAGLTTTALPQSIQAKASIAYPEAMWHGLRTDKFGTIDIKNLRSIVELSKNKDALLIGSGMGKRSEKIIRSVVNKFTESLVLDADALRPKIIKAVTRAKIKVLLPHGGEFKRLSGKKLSVAAGQAYARRTKSIVVLKGAMTCITDGTYCWHIPLGGPILARGGSGDLLAGIVTSVLARRKTLGLSAIEAVELAAVWHAQAADYMKEKLGEEAVRTTQILSGLSPALRRR